MRPARHGDYFAHFFVLAPMAVLPPLKLNLRPSNEGFCDGSGFDILIRVFSALSGGKLRRRWSTANKLCIPRALALALTSLW